jgi:predicted DNA-binding ribbon-helix-helix protein
MCRIFAGQDPASYESITKSIRLGGHATSIRLEARFWDILSEIAAGQNIPLPRFLTTLYDEALEIHGHVANFASLLRVSCLVYLSHAEHPAENAMGKPMTIDPFQDPPCAADQASRGRNKLVAAQ